MLNLWGGWHGNMNFKHPRPEFPYSQGVVLKACLNFKHMPLQVILQYCSTPVSPNFLPNRKTQMQKGGGENMKMECRHHKRWKQRGTDSIHCEGQAKDEAHFSVGTQWRLHCRSLKSPSNASLGLRGVGWGGRVNKGWVYAISALVHFVFFPPPTEIYFFCLHQMSS